MSNSSQSLANQLGWCSTTRHYLEDLGADIRHVGQIYDQTISDMASADYFDEYLKQLIPLCEEFNARAEDTVRHIDDVHVAYVNRQSDTVRAELDIILNGSDK